MGLHRGGGFAITPAADLQDTLMRRDHMTLIGHSVTQAMMLATGQHADG